jgi:hypothetical protein
MSRPNTPSELQVVDSPEEYTAKLEYMRTSSEFTVDESLFAASLGRGVLKFASSTFPGSLSSEVYAQESQREPEGKGAHFDVYEDLLDPERPWLGVYNLAGNISVRAALLPPELQLSYRHSFSATSEEAKSARINYSSIALLDPKTEIRSIELAEHTGLVILQKKDAPYVVHDISPLNTSEPGFYVKLVKPDSTKTSRSNLERVGFRTLDDYVTEAIEKSSRRPITNIDALPTMPRIVTTVAEAKRLRTPRKHRSGLTGLYD